MPRAWELDLNDEKVRRTPFRCSACDRIVWGWAIGLHLHSWHRSVPQDSIMFEEEA